MKNTIGILGLGLSGKAVIKALSRQGAQLYIADDNPQSWLEFPDLPKLNADNMRGCDIIVAAPGIPDAHPLLQKAEALGIEIICDIELWARMHPDLRTIGITGTNGKSTLTSMVHHILLQSGQKAVMAGNIGTAIFDAPVDASAIYVLELSSFQIERCPSFRPDVAALLNITPDHLDRHGTMAAYAVVKASLFDGARCGVIGVQDSYTQDIAKQIQDKGACDLTCITGDLSPQQQNQKMAIAIVQYFGVETPQALRALESYQALPHRQEIIAQHDGVLYINDSKATNAEAARSALQNYQKIIWIVGGAAKEGGLAALSGDVAHVMHACLIGEDMNDFAAWLDQRGLAYTRCGTMDKAVEIAVQQANLLKAETVLLSPACASYDQYANFMERGADFAAHVDRVTGQG